MVVSMMPEDGRQNRSRLRVMEPPYLHGVFDRYSKKHRPDVAKVIVEPTSIQLKWETIQ